MCILIVVQQRHCQVQHGRGHGGEHRRDRMEVGSRRRLQTTSIHQTICGNSWIRSSSKCSCFWNLGNFSVVICANLLLQHLQMSLV